MKKILTLIAGVCIAISSVAQSSSYSGWPANYGGVMFQSFYWDSYQDTQWTNLTSQADTLAKYFDLVWVPQSGYCNSLTNQMGYADIWWFNQKSAFGTADQLKTMISTFKSKGLGTIADVVINHKNGNTNWCDFPTETWQGHGTLTWSLADICSNDDGGKTKAAGYNVTGAADTGDDFDGCRDLDHTSANVQKNIKLYLHFLLEEMGYTGFRYDMVKGYAPKYTKLYNEDAQPAFSVGEYWDGTASKVESWIYNTGKTSAAFDFPMKYLIKSAFGGDWSKLSNYASSSVAGNSSWAQYAVTFVDNHDTGEPASNADPQRANVAAANAFILAMPGTPCVWISHWKKYKTIIKKCILARKLAGVTNTSEIDASETGTTYGGFTLTVKGKNGNVKLLLGGSTAPTTGYQLACEGDNFKYYVSDGLDISGINSITDEPAKTHEIPSFCTVADGEVCAFFEVPSTWGNVSKINCWAWDSKGNYTGNKWPGKTCTYLGTTTKGNKVYKWTWDRSYVSASGATASVPTYIIFSANSGSPQQDDMTFKNGNYYGLSEVYGNVIENTNGISTVTRTPDGTSEAWYSISGTRFSNKPTQKGLYIHNGKKIVIR